MIAKAHEAGLGVIVVHGEQPEMGRQAGRRPLPGIEPISSSSVSV